MNLILLIVLLLLLFGGGGGYYGYSHYGPVPGFGFFGFVVIVCVVVYLFRRPGD